MELGKKQMLTVVKVVDFGVYLGDDREKVLLPKKQVPAGIEPGDPIEVFLYKDSSDRLIATVNEPKLTLGESAILKVAQVANSVPSWTGDWKRICSCHLRSRLIRLNRGMNVW